MKIKPVTFQYNQRSGYDTSVTHVGVVAQELMEVAPYMVDTFSIKGDTTTYYTVNASAMTYMLINTVQEQQSEIEQLKTQVTKQQALELQNKKQQAEIEELKAQIDKINALEAKLEALLNNQ